MTIPGLGNSHDYTPLEKNGENLNFNEYLLMVWSVSHTYIVDIFMIQYNDFSSNPSTNIS